ncbi:MAG: hypothetical protein KDI13_03665 [Alphaproteobacteria bacterium]|nr:hypothetical protein [Alphaproteobacteria bacterium]
MTPPADQQKKLVQTILFLTGFAFIAAGAFGLISPQTFATLFDNDAEIAQIFSGTIIMAGVADIIIAKLVIKPPKDRR